MPRVTSPIASGGDASAVDKTRQLIESCPDLTLQQVFNPQAMVQNMGAMQTRDEMVQETHQFKDHLAAALRESAVKTREQIGEEKFAAQRAQVSEKMHRVTKENLTLNDAIVLEDKYVLDILHNIVIDIIPVVERVWTHHCHIRVHSPEFHDTDSGQVNIKVTHVSGNGGRPEIFDGSQTCAKFIEEAASHKFQGAVSACRAADAANLKEPSGATIIPFGNPGAGKSTLMNCFAEEFLFRGGISTGTGLTTACQLRVSSKTGKSFMDTPGMRDVDTQAQACLEVQQTLSKGGKYEIVFVLTLQSGRWIADDLTVMVCVLKALEGQIQNNQYSVIVNKVTKNVLKRLRGDGELLKLMGTQWKFLESQGVPTTEHIHFIPQEEALSDEDDALIKLPQDTRKFLSSGLPVINVVGEQVKQLNLLELEKQVNQARKDLQKIFEDMNGCGQLLKALELHSGELLVSSKINPVALTNRISSLMLREQMPPRTILGWSEVRADTCLHGPNWQRVQDAVNDWRPTVGCHILSADGSVLDTLGDPSPLHKGAPFLRKLEVHEDGHVEFTKWHMHTPTHYGMKDYGPNWSNSTELVHQMLWDKSWLPYHSPLVGMDLHTIVGKLDNAKVLDTAHAIEVWRGKDFSEHYGIFFAELTGFVVFGSEGQELCREGSHFQDGAWIYRIDVDGNMSDRVVLTEGVVV